MDVKDFCIAVLRNEVGETVTNFDDGFEFVVLSPDVVAFADLEKMRKHRGTADLSLRAENDDVYIRIYYKRDETLGVVNDAHRRQQSGRKFLTAAPLPQGVCSLVEKLGGFIVRELPLDKYLFEFTARVGSVEIFAQLAKKFAVTYNELLLVHTKLCDHSGSLTISGQDDRVCVSLVAAITGGVEAAATSRKRQRGK